MRPASRRKAQRVKRTASRRRRRVGQAIVLRLYISGATPNSGRAVENMREICRRLGDVPCDLQIIDVYQQPHLARQHDIVASPTLLKRLPLPARRMIGDLSEIDRVLAGLGVAKQSGR